MVQAKQDRWLHGSFTLWMKPPKGEVNERDGFVSQDIPLQLLEPWEFHLMDETPKGSIKEMGVTQGFNLKALFLVNPHTCFPFILSLTLSPLAIPPL